MLKLKYLAMYTLNGVFTADIMTLDEIASLIGSTDNACGLSVYRLLPGSDPLPLIVRRARINGRQSVDLCDRYGNCVECSQ